jgi:hypothetical protein
MNKQEWVLRNPVADVQSEKFEISARLQDFKGKTIGLFWNGKPNGDVFLNEVADQLGKRFAGLNILRIWEMRPETKTVYGNSTDNLKFMAEKADFIIGASAD